MLYTPVIHAAIHILRFFTAHYKGTIELIKHRLFSMNDKFYAIVDKLKVSVSDDHL